MKKRIGTLTDYRNRMPVYQTETGEQVVKFFGCWMSRNTFGVGWIFIPSKSKKKKT